MELFQQCTIFVLFFIVLPQLQCIDFKPRNWIFLYRINMIATYIYWRDKTISAFCFHFASFLTKINGSNRYQIIELNCTNIWAKYSETELKNAYGILHYNANTLCFTRISYLDGDHRITKCKHTFICNIWLKWKNSTTDNRILLRNIMFGEVATSCNVNKLSYWMCLIIVKTLLNPTNKNSLFCEVVISRDIDCACISVWVEYVVNISFIKCLIASRRRTADRVIYPNQQYIYIYISDSF